MKSQKYIKQNRMEKTVKIIGFKKNPYPYIYKSDVFISILLINF